MTAMERFVISRGETLALETGALLRASLKASTQATYSLGSRAYYYQGVSTIGGAVGDYLTRSGDGLYYFIETIQPEPVFSGLQTVYLVQCNAKVALLRDEGDADGAGNLVPDFVPYAENVCVYKDTTTRSMKAVNDGLIDQAIYVMHLPHKYHVWPMDRICVYDAAGQEVERYRVESVGDTLTPIDSVDEGVDVLQLSEDTR